MHDFDVGYVFRDKYDTRNKSGYISIGVILALILLIFLFVNNFLTVFLICSLFAAVNAALRMYKEYVDFPLEFELSTFAAVTMTMGYGLNAGIFAALWVGFWGDVLTGITAYTPITIGSYILAALLATLFPTSMFVLAGIVISFIISGASYLLYNITQSFSPFENVMYALTEFIGNVYFFIALAWVAKMIF